jgi:hypothetical protein
MVRDSAAQKFDGNLRVRAPGFRSSAFLSLGATPKAQGISLIHWNEGLYFARPKIMLMCNILKVYFFHIERIFIVLTDIFCSNTYGTNQQLARYTIF